MWQRDERMMTRAGDVIDPSAPAAVTVVLRGRRWLSDDGDES
jgi:hypothetical protein